MRYAIFSDVHANLEALHVVLDFFKTQQIDRYICLGDVVGYGADPEACCNLVREKAAITLLGNHDAAVSGRMDYSFYYEAARVALDWTRAQISHKNLEWLKVIPYIHVENNVTFCHSNPLNMEAFEYIFSLDQVMGLTNEFDRFNHITFIGHSHLTTSFSLQPTTAIRLSEGDISIEPDQKYIITVGSVGQPRDFDSRCCCVVFDQKAWKVEYHRLEYDIESAATKIFNTPQLSMSFGKRLYLGI
jgi:diadenosine tetraphosphatase ApaH/serine/threonine PP2A family protein phosphatase